MNMIICFVLYAIYALSVFVCGFGVFKWGREIKEWMGRAEKLTHYSLRGFAYASNKEALEEFRKILLYLAIFLFVLTIVASRVADQTARQFLTVGFITVLYSSGSIGAWSYNREKILQEYFEGTKKDSGGFIGGYLVLSLLLFSLFAVVGVWAGDMDVESLGAFLAFIAVGAVAIVGVIVVTRTISLALVFFPALLVMALLWLAMIIVRWVLAIGKTWLVNALNAYCIIGTIYFGLLSMSAVRVSLGVPAICQ